MVAVVAVGIGGECEDENGAGWIVMVGLVEGTVENKMLDVNVGEAIAVDASLEMPGVRSYLEFGLTKAQGKLTQLNHCKRP